MPVLSIALVISRSEVMLPEYVSNYVRCRSVGGFTLIYKRIKGDAIPNIVQHRKKKKSTSFILRRKWGGGMERKKP